MTRACSESRYQEARRAWTPHQRQVLSLYHVRRQLSRRRPWARRLEPDQICNNRFSIEKMVDSSMFLCRDGGRMSFGMGQTGLNILQVYPGCSLGDSLCRLDNLHRLRKLKVVTKICVLFNNVFYSDSCWIENAIILRVVFRRRRYQQLMVPDRPSQTS